MPENIRRRIKGTTTKRKIVNKNEEGKESNLFKKRAKCKGFLVNIKWKNSLGTFYIGSFASVFSSLPPYFY